MSSMKENRLVLVVDDEKKRNQIIQAAQTILGDYFVEDDMLVSEYEQAIKERDEAQNELKEIKGKNPIKYVNNEKDLCVPLSRDEYSRLLSKYDEKINEINALEEYTKRLEDALYAALLDIEYPNSNHSVSNLFKDVPNIFSKEFICDYYNRFVEERADGNWLLDIYEQNQSDELMRRIANLVREDIKDKLPCNYESNFDKTINEILAEYK